MKNIHKFLAIVLVMLYCQQMIFAQLQDIKIGIDPGHGGSDPGALGVNGATLPDEADIVLRVGKDLQAKFENLGATVVMTRTTDQYLTLSYRSNLMNQQNPDAYVSVHENSFGLSSANGTETFRHKTNGGANSQSLATKVQAKMVEHMGFTNRGVKNENFTAIKVNSSIPAVLTEGCFLSNPTEWNFITQSSNQICHANAIKNGILDYLGYGNLISANCSNGGNNPPADNSGNIAPLGSLYNVTSELSSSYSARKAFDGTVSTRWNSNGFDNFNYFIIQLDADYAVNKFVVKHASSAGLSSNLNTERYRIAYWDGFGWQSVINHNNSSKLGTTTHNVSIPVTKWVILIIDDPTFTNDKYARIPEFEIYGSRINLRSVSPTYLPDLTSQIDVNSNQLSINAQPNIITNGKASFIVKNFNEESVSMNIIKSNGEIVKKIPKIKSNTFSVDLEDFSPGIYFYYLNSLTGPTQPKKLVIQ